LVWRACAETALTGTALQQAIWLHGERSGRSKQGFREFQAARRAIQGYEAVHMIRKGQVRWLAGDDLLRQIQFIDILFDLAA
jgi:hypothetical protein